MAELNKKQAATYIFLAWLFPGLGHFMLGYRRKALILGGIILFMFVYGLFMQGQVYTPFDANMLFRWGSLVELGMGPMYIILAATPYASGLVKSYTFEFGTSFMLTAAILNYFAMIDIVDLLMGRHEESPPQKRGD